jgi:spore coat protein CotH
MGAGYRAAMGHDGPMPAVLLSALLLALACTPTTSIGGEGGEPAGSEGDTATDSGVAEDTAGDDWTAPVYDPNSLPGPLAAVGIEIDAAAMKRLDADPWGADDERGVFIDGEGVRHDVDLNYRGAYALSNVMAAYDLRNWKVKLPEGDEVLGHREWNFNYEPHFRQKLAYDLFRFAGLAVPGAEHVILEVNGAQAGMYLRYEDPDNKTFLSEQLGGHGGDLYKAAYDLPGEPQCFADLTWLGKSDADYVCHYTKKLNNEADPTDVSVLRAFLDPLNHLSEEDFPEWVAGAFDVDRLLSFLVVSNFVANWDTYPQRPKNYWLYDDRRAARMVLLPWDLDATFNPRTDRTYNQMGTGVSVLYNLVSQDYTPVHSEEGEERPLVRRLFAAEVLRTAYLDRYRELSATLLSRSYLLDRLEALEAIVAPGLSRADAQRLDVAQDEVASFVQARTAAVEAELAGME